MPIKANIPRTVCAITFNFLEQHNFHRLSFLFFIGYRRQRLVDSLAEYFLIFIFVSFSVANIFFSLPTASQKLMTNCSNLLPRLMWNETLAKHSSLSPTLNVFHFVGDFFEGSPKTLRELSVTTFMNLKRFSCIRHHFNQMITSSFAGITKFHSWIDYSHFAT